MVINIVSSSKSSCNYHQLAFLSWRTGWLSICTCAFLLLLENIEQILTIAVGIPDRILMVKIPVMLMCKQSSVFKREAKQEKRQNETRRCAIIFTVLHAKNPTDSNRGHESYATLWLILKGYYKKQWLISNDDREVSEELIQEFSGDSRTPLYVHEIITRKLKKISQDVIMETVGISNTG